MSVSATVTPGAVVGSDDQVTVSLLNLIANPTVDVEGAFSGISIEDGAVTNDKIAANTGILLSKLQSGAAHAIPVCPNSGGVPAYQVMTGDIELVGDTGVVTIADDAITTVKILDENVTAAKIADGSISGPKITLGSSIPGGASAASSRTLTMDAEHGLANATAVKLSGLHESETEYDDSTVYYIKNATPADETLTLYSDVDLTLEVNPFSEATSAITVHSVYDSQGELIYYNGTAYATLPVGTSGQFLKTQGAGQNPAWDTAAPAGSEEKFTASGTWTNSTDASLIQVVCIGAGGTGGTNNGGIGGAGGNGGYAMDWVDVSGVSAVAVTVGISGAGQGNTHSTSFNVGGATGGSSSFGAYVIGHGGSGGSTAIYAAQAASGGVSGNAGTGALQTVLDLTSSRPADATPILYVTPVANTYGGGGNGGRGPSGYGGNLQYSWCGYSGVVLVRVIG